VAFFSLSRWIFRVLPPDKKYAGVWGGVNHLPCPPLFLRVSIFLPPPSLSPRGGDKLILMHGSPDCTLALSRGFLGSLEQEEGGESSSCTPSTPPPSLYFPSAPKNLLLLRQRAKRRGGVTFRVGGVGGSRLDSWEDANRQRGGRAGSCPSSVSLESLPPS